MAEDNRDSMDLYYTINIQALKLYEQFCEEKLLGKHIKYSDIIQT